MKLFRTVTDYSKQMDCSFAIHIFAPVYKDQKNMNFLNKKLQMVKFE